jgi:hypothetical protein
MAIPPGTSLASTIVTDEQAKAVTGLSRFGATAVTEFGSLARYIGRIVGTVPEDAVGLVIGDPLHAVRTAIAGWYDIKIQELLERRKIKETQPVSLSVALPLMRGAYDESREGLRDLWAALIAATMDPERAGRVRLSFIETLRRFDPLDVLVLKTRHDAGNIAPQTNATEFVATTLRVPTEEVMISIQNLTELKCMASVNTPTNIFVTPYGRGLLRACSD